MNDQSYRTLCALTEKEVYEALAGAGPSRIFRFGLPREPIQNFDGRGGRDGTMIIAQAIGGDARSRPANGCFCLD